MHTNPKYCPTDKPHDELESLTLDEQLLFDWIMENIGLGYWGDKKFPRAEFIHVALKIWSWGLSDKDARVAAVSEWPRPIYEYWKWVVNGGASSLITTCEHHGVFHLNINECRTRATALKDILTLKDILGRES